MAETVLRGRGIATPYPALPDEITAIVVLERRLSITLPEIKWEDPDCSDDRLTELLQKGYYPIELGRLSYKLMGKDETGKKDKARSATEAVLVNIEVSQSDFSYGEAKLVELMTMRNESGHMNKTNQFPMSIPRIFGNLYGLGYDKIELVKRLKDVVYTFLDEWDRKVESEFAPPPEGRDDASMKMEFPEFADILANPNWSAPFTIGRYLRDLWRRSESSDQIKEKISFWVGAYNRFQEKLRRAKEEWESGNTTRLVFSIANRPGNEISGVAVKTDDPFVAKVAAPTVGIFINRRNDGHGAIMTRNRNLSALSQELERLEPERWYYHQSAGHLINGDRSPASELTLGRLVELAQKFPPSV